MRIRMKKFIVKFATVILYVLMVAYLSEFKIGLLLDWKALAAVFSGSLLFSVPAVFNTDSRSSRSEERRVGKECRSRWSPYH